MFFQSIIVVYAYFGSTSWYKAGQTPDAVLGEVSSSMEECRAEAVALYRKYSLSASANCELTCSVSHNTDILKIFDVRSLTSPLNG